MLFRSHYQKAIRSLKDAGDLKILARAYLTHCALEKVLFQSSPCQDFLQVQRIDPDPENLAYYQFLCADLASLTIQNLPPQYREVITAVRNSPAEQLFPAVLEIDEPLSQLIAIRVLMDLGHSQEPWLLQAVALSSAQGWKGALLLYLEKLAAHYLSTDQKEKADQIRARIDHLSS